MNNKKIEIIYGSALFLGVALGTFFTLFFLLILKAVWFAPLIYGTIMLILSWYVWYSKIKLNRRK